MSAAWFECGARLASLLAARPGLAQVSVTHFAPPSDDDNELVFIRSTSGGYQAGPTASGPLIDDAVFTLEVVMMVRGWATLDECMARLGEIEAEVRDEVAANPSLADLADDAWSVTEARAGEFTFTPNHGPDGPWAHGTVDVDVEVRIYGGNPP